MSTPAIIAIRTALARARRDQTSCNVDHRDSRGNPERCPDEADREAHRLLAHLTPDDVRIIAASKGLHVSEARPCATCDDGVAQKWSESRGWFHERPDPSGVEGPAITACTAMVVLR